MNCDDCKDLLGAFMDNELGEVQAADVRLHLAFCLECAHVCEDLTSILDVCMTESPAEIVPPNSQAMWCRINNVIEGEVKASAAPTPPAPQRRFWQLSFAQFAVAVLLIAIVSSLVTFVAIRNYSIPADDLTLRSAATQTTFEKVLSKVGLIETPQQARDRHVKEQQATIEYWNQRVQVRRAQWDRTTREAFDRNLQVIDESLNDYTTILAQDPDDDLSGEMLDSVMNDKMSFLRNFADL